MDVHRDNNSGVRRDSATRSGDTASGAGSGASNDGSGSGGAVRETTVAEAGLRALIHPILQLKEIDTNIYQGSDLWRPAGARGVFGGQVVGQALVAATKTVEGDKQVHSLHSYFLLAGDPAHPITYSVRKLRDGRSFSTRSVVASQRGRIIFFCVASFHRHEESDYSHQVPMPRGVPGPENFPDHRTRMMGFLNDKRTPEGLRRYAEKSMDTERPIDIRFVNPHNPLDGIKKRAPHQMVWMRARGRLDADEDNQTLHRCIAAYASDLTLLGTSVLPHGGSFANPAVSMTVSLDHAMWFHAPFRADEWMLYVLDSPRSGNSRGLSFGRLYTRDGTLAVTVAQEGLVRFKRPRGPKSPSGSGAVGGVSADKTSAGCAGAGGAGAGSDDGRGCAPSTPRGEGHVARTLRLLGRSSVAGHATLKSDADSLFVVGRPRLGADEDDVLAVGTSKL